MQAQAQTRVLMQSGDFAEALTLLERHWDQFPDRRDYLWSQLAACHVALRDLPGAAAVMQRALNANCMWRISLLNDPALAAAVSDPVCREVIDQARRRVADRRFKPGVLVEAAAGPSIRPLLLALHGATGCAAETLPRWLPARELGYTVAAAQASQPASADGFCWDPPRERVWQDLDEVAAMLPVHGRVVLAGFSQGGWMALQAALRGLPFAAAGVVMVGTFVGDLANMEPAARRLRVAVLNGAEDAYSDRLGELRTLLVERGHQVTLEIVPGLGHAYPHDFAARLPGLLRAVSRDQAEER